jgi:ATP-binding cassette subfamily B protein
MKNLIRSLRFFRPDCFRIILVQAFMLVGIAFNILKPWPLALIVDYVLGKKPFPKWMPAGWANLNQADQITMLVFVLLGVHLSHAGVSAIQNYTAIDVALRGLQRVRNEVFAWLQRLSLRFHHGTEAGDIVFRAGTDTCAVQTLLQQGVLPVFLHS